MTAPRTHKPATTPAQQEAAVKTPAPELAAPAKAAAPEPAKAAPKAIEAKYIDVSFGKVEVPDLTAYAAKVPTQPVTDFLTWLQAATGVEFDDGQMLAAQLAAYGLRQKWQELARKSSPVARANRK